MHIKVATHKSQLLLVVIFIIFLLLLYKYIYTYKLCSVSRGLNATLGNVSRSFKAKFLN